MTVRTRRTGTKLEEPYSEWNPNLKNDLSELLFYTYSPIQ